LEIFNRQLEKNEEFPKDAAAIDAYCQGDNKRVDYAGKLYQKDGGIYWRFGKHKGKLVSETASYAKWVLDSDFPAETKKQIRKILK